MSTIALGHFESDVRPVRHLSVVPAVRPAARITLTKRGKRALLAAAVAIVAVLAIMFGSSSFAGDQAGVAPETTTVRVLPGQTLWQIATTANPNGDIRKTVDEIVRLNSLPNASALQLGSDIAVPIYN